MITMSDEIDLIQNPAIGSIIIWKFLFGYGTKLDSENFEILFIVLPIIFNQEMRSYINSTREASGLTKVVEKMMTDKKIDIVYQISKNAEQMKELTLESIQIGLTTDLFLIDEKMNIETQNIKIPKLSKKTEDILKISEKIGVWFSKLNVLEIEKILKVRF
ncbi:MAG: hypothetical protein HFJ48_05435 [Clostridia bacterium]|nr:hypothetical protein [Clostridia bacterium]